MTLAGLPDSTANTDVTLVVLPPKEVGNTKHAPLINKSCGVEQSPSEGVIEMVTGALTPRSMTQVVVLVNGPKMLLSPSVNVVINVKFAKPPQQDSGKAVPTNPVAPGAANVPLTKLMFNGVTDVNAVVVSGIPSPLVSHTNLKAEVTVLPGLCSGTPVSLLKPWQIVVTSFGMNQQPK